LIKSLSQIGFYLFFELFFAINKADFKSKVKKAERTMTIYQRDFFEVDEAYRRIDSKDSLLWMDKIVDWSGLQKIMKEIKFERDNSHGRGRPALCGFMMGKIFIMQSLHNLSDESCEFQINDRLSFKRFLSLSVNAKAPDAKSIWLWRERIVHSGLDAKIFQWFETELKKHGFEAKEGQIVDATFISTHKPTGRHKKQLEQGIPLTNHQVAQIDPDANFSKKGGQNYHGYKNHIMIDNKHKFIRAYKVTPASVHDSCEFESLLESIDETADTKDKNVFADSAYKSERAEQMLTSKGLISHIHERAYRNKPLTSSQKENNKERSKFRARVEHVFGQMTTSMGGLMIHTLNKGRAQVKMTFKNLAYNLKRFVFLEKLRLTQSNCV
jgi:IS5 family transposase